MNPEAIAKAYRAIGQGYYEAADVLLEAASAPQAVAPVLTRPSALPQDAAWEVAQPDPNMPEFPPLEYEDLPVAATPQTEPLLGRCPAHDRAWTVKPAGVSKAGKSYTAFFKCDGKDSDGTYCNRKPVKAWADSHARQLVVEP